jgi:hypothetical protein
VQFVRKSSGEDWLDWPLAQQKGPLDLYVSIVHI